MDAIGMLAMQLGSSVLGGIGSQVSYGLGELTGYNQKQADRQYEQQAKLTNLQAEKNKDLFTFTLDRNLQAQKELFEYTNYSKQVEELEKAGLNPGLLYAKGGAGGTTAAATGQANLTGATAANETERKRLDLENTIMGIQLSKAMAEIDKTKSEAEVNKANAEFIKGAKTEEIEQSILNIIQDTKNKEALNTGIILDNRMKELQNMVKENTVYEDIKQIIYNAEKAYNELEILINNKEISNETKEEVIKSYKLQVENLIKDLLTKDANIRLNEAEIQKKAADIAIGWYNAKSSRTSAERMTWEQALGGELHGLTGGVGKAIRKLLGIKESE
jgi:hypothetical protein